MQTTLAPLFALVEKNSGDYSLDKLTVAYQVAEKAHSGQVRKSGEPYITHPLAVTEILEGLCLLYTSPSPRD